jgi:hypothetical protein
MKVYGSDRGSGAKGTTSQWDSSTLAEIAPMAVESNGISWSPRDCKARFSGQGGIMRLVTLVNRDT